MESPRIYVITGIIVAGLLVWLLAAYKTPWNLQRYAGAFLVAVGLGGMVLARYQLGKSFSIRPEAHELVTTGIYSKIRNPIYVFGTLMLTGLVLVLRRPHGFVVVAGVIIAQMIQARREAEVLEKAFGDLYREYRRKTWF